MRRFRPILTALAAVALAASPTPAVATDSAPTPTRSAEAGTRTLYAGNALVAGTKHSTLQNGWYTLETWSGMAHLSETIPVAGSNGATTSGTGTWFRSDPTGNFNRRNDHTRLRLFRNGDLALITAAGRRLWHSNTDGSGAVRLTLHRGGLLALHTKSGKIVWSSRSGQVQLSGGMSLKPGQQLRDASETAHPDGVRRTLTMQRDGNLVHRCGSRIDWQTHTSVPGSTLRMHRGGALKIVTPKGRTVWSSHSGGHDYAYFNGARVEIMADDLDLIWYAQKTTMICPG